MKQRCILLCGLILFTSMLQAQTRTVSVIPLTSSSGVGKAELQVITEYLEAGLINTGAFEVIAADQRDAILGEQKFSLGGCVDQSCAMEIGRLLSAQYMVFGSVTRQGSSYVLSVKKVNVRTSTIDSNGIDSMLTLSASQIEETTRKLAYQLAGIVYESAEDRIGSYTGQIRLRVSPASAKAVFNLTTELSSYPAVLEDVKQGFHGYYLEYNGYKTGELRLEVSGTEDKTIIEDLMSPVSLTLSDRTDWEADVFLDGVFRGTTESGTFRISGVSFGRHALDVRKDGYSAVTKNIIVAEDEYRLFGHDRTRRGFSVGERNPPGGMDTHDHRAF